MKAEQSKYTRIKINENYEVLRSIEQEISNRIKLEFASEIQGLKAENDLLYKEEKAFIDQAKEILKRANTTTLLKVKTQTGKNSELIREYTGTIQSEFNCYDSIFNFISPNNYDGKPFSIGFSCLLSIEII